MKNRVIFILGVVGLLVSGYLVAKTNDPSSVICSVGGGCETVLSSQYAKLYGISVAWYGVAWYIGTLIAIYLSLFTKQLKTIWLRYWLLAGLAFSLYLLGIEMFKIHAYCTWCLVSLAVVVLMTGLTFSINTSNSEVKKS